MVMVSAVLFGQILLLLYSVADFSGYSPGDGGPKRTPLVRKTVPSIHANFQSFTSECLN